MSGPEARGPARLSRHLYEAADLGQAAIDLFGLLAAEVDHQAIDAEIAIGLHGIGRRRDRRRDDDLELLAAFLAGLGESCVELGQETLGARRIAVEAVPACAVLGSAAEGGIGIAADDDGD